MDVNENKRFDFANLVIVKFYKLIYVLLHDERISTDVCHLMYCCSADRWRDKISCRVNISNFI